MLNKLIADKNLGFIQPGWTRMIAPSHDKVLRNRLVLGYMRRKLSKDDNIADMLFESVTTSFRLYKSNSRKAPYGINVWLSFT